MHLQLPRRRLALDQPIVMGILNVTPDSFSDGGKHFSLGAALQHARRMVGEGAGILDVGGESTRPGSAPVDTAQEIDRVVPVIEAIRRELDVVISVDTMKPDVMRAACAAGAEMINDVGALRAAGAVEAARDAGAAVCLMHMQGEPKTMQAAPHYDDAVREVGDFLAERVATCIAAGISRDRLCIDPGIGFGKTLDHNLALLASDAWSAAGVPLLIGVSRKSMFGQLLGRPVDARLPGALAVAAIAVWQGAAIVRVHDVQATVDAVRVAHALRQSRNA